MAVFLDQAKEKILDMRENGTAGSIQITHFAVGDAAYYVVNPAQTALVSPVEISSGVYTKAITSATNIGNHTVQYICTLTEDEAAGHDLTELALIDADGLMTCIKTFSPKAKTNAREMIFKINDTFEEG